MVQATCSAAVGPPGLRTDGGTSCVAAGTTLLIEVQEQPSDDEGREHPRLVEFGQWP